MDKVLIAQLVEFAEELDRDSLFIEADMITSAAELLAFGQQTSKYNR